MKYLVLIEGFDPTSVPTTPTNAQLLQEVREAQFASDIGGLILSSTAPNVVQYPILARFRWVKTDVSLVPIGEFYYHDGSSWVIEKPAVGSITGSMLVDGTVGIEKLNAAGDPLQIIRINAGGTAFEFVDITDAIPDSSLSTDKLAAGSGADLALLSGLGGSWAPVSLQYFFGRIYDVVGAVTDFSSQADKIVFNRSSDDTVRGMTIGRFFTSGFDQATVIASTEGGDFGMVLDASDGLYKKVLLSNWLPNSGVVAGTYGYPTSVTVNAKGQVTAITAGTQGQRTSAAFESTERTLPTTAGSGGALTVAHGLGAAPVTWGMRLVCKTADGSFSPGDIIDYRDVIFDTGATDYNFPYLLTVSALNIVITSPAIAARKVTSKATGAYQTFTPGSWVGLLWATT